ncbi:MAG: hypothetical protein WDN28_06055 [Chthoniobacter sp.]
MADEQDSWLSGIGVDIGSAVDSIKEKLSSEVSSIESSGVPASSATNNVSGAPGDASPANTSGSANVSATPAPASPAPAAGEDKSGEGGEGSGSGIDFKFSGEVPEIELYKFGSGSKVKGEIKLQGEYSGELVEKGTENPIKAGVTANQGIKAEVELGKQKGFEICKSVKVEEVKELLNIEGSKKRIKLSVSVEAKIKTGAVWLSGVATAELKAAEVEWEKLKKNPDNITILGGEVAGGVQGEGTIPLNDTHDAKVSVKMVISGSVEPNWPVIFAEAAKKGVEKTLEEGGKVAEEAAVDAGIDVLISGGIVLVGVATVAGAIYSIIRGWEIGDLSESYAPAVKAAKDGFKTAMTGAPAPTDQFGKVGWDQGKANYDAVFAKAKKDNPQATDDAIKKAVADKADDALAAVGDQIDQSVRSAMWDGYLAAHTTLLMGNDARWGYVACFGQEPDSNNPDKHWKDYMTQHPIQSKTSAK